MKPIFIILYAVIITLLLTLALPRLRQENRKLQRFLWFTGILGGTALLILTSFVIL